MLNETLNDVVVSNLWKATRYNNKISNGFLKSSLWYSSAPTKRLKKEADTSVLPTHARNCFSLLFKVDCKFSEWVFDNGNSNGVSSHFNPISDWWFRGFPRSFSKSLWTCFQSNILLITLIRIIFTIYKSATIDNFYPGMMLGNC